MFKNKPKGFYALLGCMALSLVTAIVYACIYASTRYISWTGFWIMLAGVAVAAVLVVTKLHRFAPSVLLATNFIALLYHVY